MMNELGFGNYRVIPFKMRNMNAFTASAPSDDRRSRVDADCDYHLPWLKCETCEAADPMTSPWAESGLWYPMFSLSQDVDNKKFNEDYVTTVSELIILQKQVLGKGAKQAKLLPGSGLGPVRVKRFPKRGTDFLWSSFRLLASQRAIQALEAAGLQMNYGEALAPGDSPRSDYVALQLDPVLLYSPQTLKEMTLIFCPSCGHCRMRDVRAKPNGPRQYIRSLIPEEAGLVRALEGFETLATERFMEVVKTEQLTGIEFEEFGVYV